MSFARVRIDLDALASNYQLFQQHAAGQVGAVVKADGYGLGAGPIVKRLVEEGCHDFFVATLEEAIRLRRLPIDAKIFVFEPPPSIAGVKATLDAACVPVVNSVDQLPTNEELDGAGIAVHIDTGMNRLGIPHDAVDVERLKSVNVVLLLTHLACADDPDNSFNQVQVNRFQAIATQLPDIRTSIGNSAATLNGPAYQGDLARPGIGLYGANPYTDRKNPTSVVASCEAQILAIHDVDAGDSIGYGRTYEAKEPMRIAVVGIGYADGVPRVLSNRGSFAFGEAVLPIRGRVSMDVTQLDVTGCPSIKVGDWVEFFGYKIDCDDVAKTVGSFGYEFLTSLGPRVERRYI